MKTFAETRQLSTLRGPLNLAIGVFDGVHLGHQAVICAALASGKENGGEVVVVTFDPHPVTVLAPQLAPRLLTSTEHKARLLAELLQVKNLLVVTFDRSFSEQSGATFIRQLWETAPFASISVGKDFQFGKGRSGNVALLESLSRELSFALNATEIVTVNGVIVSSTKIREAVALGDFVMARALLGRNYTVLGTVIPGRQLGRTLAFPTANLTVHSEQLPPNGVYAVRASLMGQIHRGVANLGCRPSIENGDQKQLLEVHLFDFDQDIYGQDLEVDFIQFLRAERKFDGLEALKAQIADDAQKARQLLAGLGV
jgi:riboflavin kinase / FMN adenylyltransferase